MQWYTFCSPEKVEQTVEFIVTWDALILTWRHGNEILFTTFTFYNSYLTEIELFQLNAKCSAKQLQCNTFRALQLFGTYFQQRRC